MDIAAQELNRVKDPFACGIADKADQISVLWTGRSDAVPLTGRRGERSGHNTAKRQPDGMRNSAERRHLERTQASGIAGQNKKRRPHNADAFA